MHGPNFNFGRVDTPLSSGRDDGLHPLTSVKLWDNPCWLSFRINHLAFAFNNPVYGWVESAYGLKRPEYVVLYSLSLKDGLAAQDISISSGFPKNTMSRAIQTLLERQLIRRAADETDRRSFVLRLTEEGRAIVAETTPPMVERERIMLDALTPAERHMLFDLLGKIILDSPRWPAAIQTEEKS